MRVTPTTLRAVLACATALALPGCGSQAQPPTTVQRSAEIALSATPEPVTGVLEDYGDRRFDYVVHVRETGGVGGMLDRISDVPEIAGVPPQSHVRVVNQRLEAYGAYSRADTFWISPPFKLERLTVSIQFTDDLGHVLARTVVVPAVDP